MHNSNLPDNQSQILSDKPMLTIGEAAKCLGVCDKTLRRWETSGKLIPQRTNGNQRRYSEKQIWDFKHTNHNHESHQPQQINQQPLLKSFNFETMHEAFYFPSTWKAVLVSLAGAFLIFGSIGLAKSPIIKKGLNSIPFIRQHKASEEQILGVEDNNVLGVDDTANYLFNVNVPAKFVEKAVFEKDVEITGKIINNSLVNSITAGSGISVTSGANPTITNTGILSLSAGTGISVSGSTITNTGITSLSAGSGISVSGSTITNSDLGSSQKIFKTIKVSGQSNVVADSNTDDLTFVAGTGIILTTDADNDKLTITGADPGWTDDGTVVRLTTITDKVGIGTTNPGYTLDVNGTLQITGSGFTGLRMPTGATENYVLTTDGEGNASWTNTSGGGSFGAWTLTGSTIYPNETSYNLVLGSKNVLDSVAKFVNTGSTLLKPLAVADLSSGGNIGDADDTVDVYTSFNLTQNTAGQTITLPTPTSNVSGRLVYLSNTGSTPFSFLGSTVLAGTTTQAMWNGTAWTLAGSNGGLPSGTTNNTVMRWNSATSQWLENTNVTMTSDGNISSAGLNVSNYATVSASLALGYASAPAGPGNAVFSGMVGIGTSAPSYTLHLTGTPDNYLGYVYNSGTTSSAGGLYLRTDGTGNIFTANYNGTDMFTVSGVQSAFNNPVSFNAADDVSLAYDLVFTNATASYIKSTSSLGFQAGEPFNSSDINLITYNKGNVVVDSEALVTNYAATVSGQLVVGTANPTASTFGNFFLTNSSTFGKALAILNQTESQNLIAASSSGVAKFNVTSAGNIQSAAGTLWQPIADTVNALSIAKSDGTVFAAFDSTNQKVGIGTTVPSSKLSVAGDSTILASATSNSNTGFATQGLLLYSSSPNSGYYSPSLSFDVGGGGGKASIGTVREVGAGGNLLFFVDTTGGVSTERLRISSSGKIGVGTTAPTAKLDVNGDVNIAGYATASASLAVGYTNSLPGPGHAIFQNSVGIGTTNPGYLLQVGEAGDGTEARANGWNALSDIRFKDNVSSLGNALDKILKLNPISFDWKSTGKSSLGFAAQEVANIFPEVVSTDKNGILSLNYDALTAPIVGAIKEQQDQLSNFQLSISNLQSNSNSQFSNNENWNMENSTKIENLKLKIDDLDQKYSSISSQLDKILSLREISIASDEATPSTSSAMISDEIISSVLGENVASFSSILVREKANINRLFVADSLSNGLLTLNGTSNNVATIDSLTLPLRLQNNALAEISFMGDKVIIDTKGNLTVKETIKAKKYEVDVADVAAASAGKITINKDKDSIIIETSALDDNSLIFATPDEPVAVSAKKIEEKKFEIRLAEPAKSDLKVSWWIIN